MQATSKWEGHNHAKPQAPNAARDNLTAADRADLIGFQVTTDEQHMIKHAHSYVQWNKEYAGSNNLSENNGDHQSVLKSPFLASCGLIYDTYYS